jgi:hypothetical protein
MSTVVHLLPNGDCTGKDTLWRVVYCDEMNNPVVTKLQEIVW